MYTSCFSLVNNVTSIAIIKITTVILLPSIILMILMIIIGKLGCSLNAEALLQIKHVRDPFVTPSTAVHARQHLFLQDSEPQSSSILTVQAS